MTTDEGRRQRRPHVAGVAEAMQHDGGGPGATQGVFAQYFAAGGTPVGSQTLVNNASASPQLAPDVAMDPQSPSTLYAAAYQRRRTTWGFNGGGPHSGLYKTSDGGATWKKLSNGLPSDGDAYDQSNSPVCTDPAVIQDGQHLLACSACPKRVGTVGEPGFV